MKSSKALRAAYCLLCVLLLSPFATTANAAGPAPVNLGSTSGFAVLAGYAVTNVPASAITGDVGLSPAAESFITGFSQTDWPGYATSPQVTGKIYAADMANPTPIKLTTAKGDLTIAYNDAMGRTPIPTGPFLNPGSGNLAGLSLVPGLYKFTGEAIASTDFTLTGSANDVWIFQIASALTVSNGVHVTLAGGAQASHIFWQVGTSAILGTTCVFHGTIIADASVTMQTGATLNGRALAFSGTVALASNVITVPPVTTYTLTYSAGPNGSISGATSQTVNYGDNGTAVEAIPAPGYHFTQWSDGLKANPRRDMNVTASISVTASFASGLYTVTFQTDGTAGAALDGATSQSVAHGGNCTPVTAGAPVGFHFVKWTKAGADYSTSNPVTVTNVTEDTSLTAVYAATPIMSVFVGSTPIVNGGGPIDFGSSYIGLGPLSKTFIVKNTGKAALNIVSITIPNGYAIVTSPSAAIPAGGTDRFVVALTATAAGTFTGGISIANNDTIHNPYHFSITGTLLAVPANLNDYYKVSYKKPGAKLQVLSISSSGTILIEGGTAKDTLQITFKPGKAKTTPPPPILQVSSPNGGFKSLATVAPIIRLKTGEAIGSISANKAYVERVEAKAVGSVRMTWILEGLKTTTIETSGTLERGKASVQLNGVILQRLGAPQQTFSLVSSASKKTGSGVAVGGLVTANDPSGRDVDCLEIASLSVRGAGIDAQSIVGRIGKVSATFAIFNKQLYSADIKADMLDSTADKMSVTATGGSISGVILAKGKLVSVRATRKKLSNETAGGSIGVTSASASATTVTIPETIIVSGLGGSDSDIQSVFASKTINAAFIAGADDTATTASSGVLPVTPNFKGVVKGLNMDKGGVANGVLYMNPSGQNKFPKPFPDPTKNKRFSDNLARQFTQ
ncbi:MAG: ice-binding family protein [Candidatus Sumerlaeota bacterium]|nr:ice-binding family protein [Candidatus Sumerlaeota bacterium]